MDQEQGQLPPGSVFAPSDLEAARYLMRRVTKGEMAPFGVIPELSAYDVPPWQLAGNLTYSIAGEFYCFTRLRRSRLENTRPERSVGSFGSWVASGKHVLINDESGRTVGHKTFYKFKSKRTTSAAATASKWVMYEYRLDEDTFRIDNVEDVKNTVMCLIKKSGKGVDEDDWNKGGVNQQRPPILIASRLNPAAAAAPSYKCNAPAPEMQCCRQSSDVTAPTYAILGGPSSSAMPCRGIYGDEWGENVVQQHQPPLASAPISPGAAVAPSYERREASMGANGEQQPVVQCYRQSSDAALQFASPSGRSTLAIPCPPPSALLPAEVPLAMIPALPPPPEVSFPQAMGLSTDPTLKHEQPEQLLEGMPEQEFDGLMDQSMFDWELGEEDFKEIQRMLR